jgi:hypothetical protein
MCESSSGIQSETQISLDSASFQQGLILPSAKKKRKILFSVYTGNSKQTKFSCKQKKILHRFFGAASWQDFCKFFIETQL